MATLEELKMKETFRLLDEEQRIEDIKKGREDAITDRMLGNAGKPTPGQSYDYYTAYAKEHLTAALNLLGGKDEPI
jgi:hypothetical protein